MRGSFSPIVPCLVYLALMLSVVGAGIGSVVTKAREVAPVHVVQR